MGVDNYKTVEKQSVDEFIKNAIDNTSCVICATAPIEHYTIEELIDLAEKLERKDVVITLKAEHSNFYQGVMIGLVKRKNVNEKYSKFL